MKLFKCNRRNTTPFALILIPTVILTLFVASPARGQFPTFDSVSGGVLDQEYVEDLSDPRYVNGTTYAPISAYQYVAQSFVAGHNATLSHIEIRAGATWFTPITLSVLDFSDSLPNEVLASRTLMPGNPTLEYWVTFNLRNHSLRLTAGKEYAIALELPSTDGSAGWLSSLWGDPVRRYEPGGVYFRHPKAFDGEQLPNEGRWYRLGEQNLDNDLFFRVFVVPVPEPSAFVLLVIGCAAFAIRRRR